MNKKSLSERDICTQFITPALQASGWDLATQVREEVTFTVGRAIVRGETHSRGYAERANYRLCCKPKPTIVVIYARGNVAGDDPRSEVPSNSVGFALRTA